MTAINNPWVWFILLVLAGCLNTPSPRAWAFSEHKGEFWLRTQRWKLYDDGRLFDMYLDPTESMAIPESRG